MHKVVKILGHVLSAAVLLLIVLPILLSLVLNIPAVQNFVVHKATEIVSRKLGTTVSIGHVDIGLFNKLKADDIYVQDYQQDTLLYAGHLAAFVSDFGFSGGGMVLGGVKLADAKLCLHETPSGILNIKEFIDHLSNKDKPKAEGSFKLTLSSVTIENLEFCLEKYQHKDPPFGIDFSHLHIRNIRGHVHDLTIEGSTIGANILSLACSERSGFIIDQLRGKFRLSSGFIGFDNLLIRTAQSDLDIPRVKLEGGTWDNYSDFINKVPISAEVRYSELSTNDLAYFVPQLRDSNLSLRNLDLTMDGTVSDFTAWVSTLGPGDDTRIDLQAALKGLPDINRTHFDLDIRELTTRSADIDRILTGLSVKRLPAKTLQIIRNAGQIGLTGKFAGTLTLFRMQAALTTQLGNADCNMLVTPLRTGNRKVNGGISARNIQLGELLGNPKFGSLSVSAKMNGMVERKFADANVKGEVTNFQYSGYSYDSIRFDGHIKNKEFDGRIAARDANLDFDFAGMVDLNDSLPRYDFSLDLHRADLAKLHINPRDSISELSARMVARAAGRSFDDLNGNIRIMDATYRYNDKQIQTNQIVVVGENTPQSKFVELRSDFADITFRSKTSYKQVIEYLKMSAWKYLPMLYDRNKYIDQKIQETAAVNDFSLLSVQLKNINPIMDAVAKGLQIANGSQLQLLFNPSSDKLSLRASSEYIEQGDRMLVTNINVNASNHGDSLAFFTSSEDFYLGALHLRNLSVTGGAREGRLQISTGFSDSLKQMSGLLGIAASLSPKPGPNGRVLDVRILPSHISRGDKTWQIFAQRIQLDTAQVAIDNFYVMNAQQDLLINGVASRNRKDSVSVRLRNFDLSAFSQVLDRMGYELEGVTNGSATIKSALKGAEVTADIRMDSLALNGISAPPLRLVSKWDFQRDRARFMVENRMKRDTLIEGFYAPKQVRYYARATLDSLDIGLLNPILKGVISDTKGLARINLVLTGQHREAEIKGSVHVQGLQTKVDFTQVTYNIPEVTLEVKKNHLQTKNTPVFDSEGHRAGLDFDLNLEHLSNIAYSVRVTPQQLLVLNTTSRDNNLFYGRVYATGVATITGNKRGVNMDVSATTEGNSNFNLSLTGKSNLSAATFITFVSAQPTDTTNFLEQKKLLFERRRTTQEAAESSMNINLALNVQPNLDFRMTPLDGNVIQARGEGLLNLEIKPRQNIFQIFGDYTLSEGYYNLSLENLVNRKFTIENGSSIMWSGSPINAMLNISAVYRLKASLAPLLGNMAEQGSNDRSLPVDCVISLSDRLTNPTIKFDVRIPQADADIQAIIANTLTPETMSTQFAYLLLTNSFMTESGGVNNNIGSSVSSAVAFQFLTSQLSKLLSSDSYNILLSYRPQTEMSSEELDFGVSKSLINNRLLVEVEGNYVVDKKQAVNNISNLMGEAYVTWLIDRSGNLRLRAFTHTIDRFDENQGLQETGIGISYKEDFNNFKDLRQRVKGRFTNKQRKEKREARREAKAAAKDSLMRIQETSGAMNTKEKLK